MIVTPLHPATDPFLDPRVTPELLRQLAEAVAPALSPTSVFELAYAIVLDGADVSPFRGGER